MSLFQPDIPFPAKVLSINELTAHLKNLVEKDSVLAGVWIQGEVSNLVKAASGHCYFTLKDDKAVIKAALWAMNRRRLGIDFKNGDFVMVYGGISVYPPRGDYQIIVSDLRPAGVGALYEAYEKLKSKLQAEGLFDSARKMPLPLIPKGIGIVTSPRGAVVQDIFRVVRRRFKNMPLYLVPVKVQGDGAAKEIAAGISRLNADNRVDVIIVARGGGSIEDLWAFNEEIVARAISNSEKPVISAVGHETDTTIADLVADKRAATPSVAGELAVPVKDELIETLELFQRRLTRSLRNWLDFQRQIFKRLSDCRFLQKPELMVSERRNLLLNYAKDIESMFGMMLQKTGRKLETLNSRLVALNPVRLLQRGYIMVTDIDGNVVNSVNNLKAKQNLNLHFADGKVEVVVRNISNGGK